MQAKADLITIMALRLSPCLESRCVKSLLSFSSERRVKSPLAKELKRTA